MSILKRKTASTAQQQLITVLKCYLHANCSSYEWAGRAHGMIRARDWTHLYELAGSLSTEVYDSASEHLVSNQFAALILKYPWKSQEIGLPDPRLTAISKFRDAERRCQISNRRFLVPRLHRSRYASMIYRMREDIARLLGPSPDLESIYQSSSFSSGAAIGVHGNATNLYRKLFADGWTVSPCALPHATAAIRSNEQFLWSVSQDRGSGEIRCLDPNPQEWQTRFELTTCNKVSFVPKNAKAHRAIAVEPLLNSYVQKGIDVVLRHKLLKWGIDLRDQTRNQLLARDGSIDGSLSTIDLSSASDSISINLVKMLLPDDWFSLLNETRSPSYRLDGRRQRYHKFVSMGNGFCFPLETLIFAAAVRACRGAKPDDRRYAVYGDDIIVPTSYAPALLDLLRFMGFRPNVDKTFLGGPFRESCGADWYLGQDVRPVYLDYQIDDVSRLMIFHNATLRSPAVADLFREIRDTLREMVPERKRLLRPMLAQPPRESRETSWVELCNLNGAFSVALDTFMSSSCGSWSRTEYRWRWREFLFTAKLDRAMPDDEVRFEHARYLNSLHSGLAGTELSLRYTAKLRTIMR